MIYVRFPGIANSSRPQVSANSEALATLYDLNHTLTNALEVVLNQCKVADEKRKLQTGLFKPVRTSTRHISARKINRIFTVWSKYYETNFPVNLRLSKPQNL
jgi:hypothetical protein